MHVHAFIKGRGGKLRHAWVCPSCKSDPRVKREEEHVDDG